MTFINFGISLVFNSHENKTGTYIESDEQIAIHITYRFDTGPG